jgi:hypothetical protein
MASDALRSFGIRVAQALTGVKDKSVSIREIVSRPNRMRYDAD